MSGEDSKVPASKGPADNRQNPEASAKGSPSGRDFTLSESDAAAGAPADESVCGEEDPGVGLEFLVKELNDPDKPRNHNGDKHDK